jgi:hypothetical protein
VPKLQACLFFAVSRALLLLLHAVKVALTAEDMELHNLPSDLDAKSSSPNYAKFIKK